MKKLIFLISFCFIYLSNVQSQDCSVLTISNDTNLSLDTNGEAVVIPEMLMFGDISQCNYEIALSSYIDNNNFIIVIPYGPSITVTCEFIGTYVVSVRDIDSGNVVWANLIIEDMNGACPLYFGPDTYSLIYDSRNFGGVMDTEVTLNGNVVDEVYDYLDTIPKSDLIDGENVLDFPPSNSNIVVGSSGITTLDIVEINKMFVFDVEFPLRAVLADVDGSGYLNVNDMVLLREFILGIPNVILADNFLYRSKTHQFDADFDAFNFTDLNFREYRFDKADVTQEDLEFFVYQYGDIIGSTTITDSIGNDEVTNRSNLQLVIEDRAVTAGETILVPMTLSSEDFDIKGLQLGLVFNGLELNDLNHNYTGNVLMHNYVSDQDFRISYVDQNGAEDFNVVIEFDVLQSGILKDMISLNNDFVQESVGFDHYANIDIAFQETSAVQDIEGISSTMIGNELFIEFPNVHTDRVVVYDVQGKVITSIHPKSSIVKVDMSGLNDGMFFVSTLVNGTPFTQKIVLINSY